MVRMFKALVLSTSLAFAGTAYSLGLGEITLKSSLNQPLLAEIELLQEEGMSPGEILPTLASQDDFKRAGIIREFFLSNLQFSLAGNSNGQMIMVVTTKEPVQEPFLNFMIEVNWPTGRLLKEFTLLLDPPLYDQASLTSFSAPTEAVIETVPAPVTTTVVETTTTTVKKPVPVRQEAIKGNEYRVQQDDTLWQIALRVRKDSKLSVQQVMLAIQQMNPDAFINNNINLLKEGSLLVVPTAEEVRDWGLAEAVNEVGRQNNAVNASADSKASVSAVPPKSTDNQSQPVQNPAGYLEVVNDKDSTQGAAASGDQTDQTSKLSAELTTALELNDKLSRENDELRSRLDALQNQLDLLQKMVLLQSETGVALANQEAMHEAAEAVHSDSEGSAGSATDNSAAHSMGNTAAGMPAASDHLAGETEQHSEGQMATEAMGHAEAVGAEGAGHAGLADHAEAAAGDHAAVPHGHDPEPQSFVAYLWKDLQALVTGSLMNLVLAASAVLLLVALVAMAIIKRRKTDSEPGLPLMAQDDDDFDIDGLGIDNDLDVDLDDGVAASTPDALQPVKQADADAGHADIVAEADIYIAYGRYDQAEELLKAALAEGDNREEVKLKLAEVYVETGNASGFSTMESELQSGSTHAVQAIKDLRAQLPGASPLAEPDGLSASDFDMDSLPDDLDSLSDPVPNYQDKASEKADALDDDLGIDDDLSFESWDGEKTDFNLDDELLNVDEDAATKAPQDGDLMAVEAGQQADDGSITFDLDSGGLVSDEAGDSQPVPAMEASDDEDDFLLEEIEKPSSGDDSDALDFDFDGELASFDSGTSAAETSAEDAPEETRLALDGDAASLEQDLTSELEDLDNAFEFELDDALETDSKANTEDVTAATSDLDDKDVAEDAFESLNFDDGSVDFESALEELDNLDSELQDFDAEVEKTGGEENFNPETTTASVETDSDDEPMFVDDSFDLGDLEDLNADIEGLSATDDFDMGDGSDEISTKLDLARAYIDMDEKEGAKEILQEVLNEGNDDQVSKAKELLSKLK